jgi:hypothetical protein
MLDCLTTLVGLSDKDCSCFEDSRPAAYNTSESGYFLTDPEHGMPLLESVYASQDCSDGSIWDVMQKARTSAILDFETDLHAWLYSRYSSRFTAFTGNIGQEKTSALLTGLGGTYTGIRLRPKGYRGAKLTIQKIKFKSNYTGNVTVDVYSSEDVTAPLFSETVAATAGNWIEHTPETAIELDLWSEECDDLYYYIVYDGASVVPYNNKFTCCGKKQSWLQYTDAAGISTNDLEAISSTTSRANGISLTAFVRCEGSDWLCDLDTLGDYNAKSVIAKTIQFKGAAKLISSILDSGNVNFYTLLGREQLYGKRNHFNKRYEENIRWIVENIPGNVTDCFKCSENRIKRRAILV